MIDWTQVIIVLISVGLSAGSLSAVFGYALAVRREKAQNSLINSAGVDKRVNDIWTQTTELFHSERERNKADFSNLRDDLAEERQARIALQNDNMRLSKFISELQQELIEERAARLRDAADNESRINALVYQVRVLREENDQLKQLLTEHGITLEE
jgi:hypothetical protein